MKTICQQLLDFVIGNEYEIKISRWSDQTIEISLTATGANGIQVKQSVFIDEGMNDVALCSHLRELDKKISVKLDAIAALFPNW